LSIEQTNAGESKGKLRRDKRQELVTSGQKLQKQAKAGALP